MTPEEAAEITADCVAILNALAGTGPSSDILLALGSKQRPGTRGLQFDRHTDELEVRFTGKRPRRGPVLRPDEIADVALFLKDLGLDDEAKRISVAFKRMVTALDRH